MSATTKIERPDRPGNPETDYHGEYDGQWWHIGRDHKPLEPCACTDNDFRAGRRLDGVEHNGMPGEGG